MIRPGLRCLLIGTIVAVALSAAAPQAEACWGCHHGGGYYGYGYGYGWSYGGWGCGCTPCCDYGYVGCLHGCRRGLSCCGGCGYYACGNYGCGYDCCGTVDTCCGGASMGASTGQPTQAPTPAKKPAAPPPAMPTEPAPMMPAPTEPAPAMPGPAPALPPKTTGTSADDSGVLTVWVPFDAKVTVNGLDTRSTGSRRQFISYGLKPGLSYKYVVRAQVVRNGQVQEETQTAVLTAGQINAVAFGFNTSPSQQVAAAH